jgi:Xaa-Pro aminopeptidase
VDHSARRALLAARISELDADAFLITRLPNVRHLTGFTGSNGQLVLTRDGGLFLTDGRYMEQSAHEVPDLDRRPYSGEFGAAFAQAVSELGVRRVAFESTGVTYRTYQTLEPAGAELIPTLDEVERLRWVKDPEELAFLEAAQGLADDAFELVVGKLTEGMTEREVAFELDTALRRAGAEHTSFDTIVAFGESATEPHHSPTGRALQRGDMVKLDFGSVVDGYHSDMTRTFAFGEPDPGLKEIYQLVLQAQQAGIDAVRPGITGGDADRAAREIIAGAGYGDRYPHSLGHGVGLEVHEGPSLRAGGTDVLPEGAVVTVEPGIYVPGLGGVRIEDMVAVTAEGCRPIPRTSRELVIL